MANWQIVTEKADQAAQQIQSSAATVNKLIDQYTAAKAQLFSDWEGSMKDEFVQQTGVNFESLCAALVKSLQALATDVTSSKQEHLKRDEDGANIIRGQ